MGKKKKWNRKNKPQQKHSSTKPLPQSPPSVAATDQTQGNSNPRQGVAATTVRNPVGSQVVVSPTEEAEARAQRTECRDKWRLGVEAVALFVAFGGLVGLIWTLHTAQKQLRVTERNSRLEQRAWIDVSVKEGGGKIAENKPLTFDVRVENTGKTFARCFEQRTTVTIVPSNQAPDLSGGLPAVQTTTGMVAPNKSFDIPVSMLSKERGTVIDPPGPTKAELADLIAGRAYIAIFGKATYQDIYNVPHWVQFCKVQVFATGEYYYQKCTEYNDTDTNERPGPPRVCR